VSANYKLSNDGRSARCVLLAVASGLAGGINILGAVDNGDRATAPVFFRKIDRLKVGGVLPGSVTKEREPGTIGVPDSLSFWMPDGLSVSSMPDRWKTSNRVHC
jgi:hypothetical protein